MNLRFVAMLLLALLPAAGHSATRIFYDGFETGNSNLWSQEGSNARCPVVSGSADGLQGPRAGSYMLRCNWSSDGNSAGTGTIEALARNGSTSEYNSEVLWRWWFRRDSSLNGGTGPKLFRIATGSSFGDLMVANSATTGSFEAAIFDANGSTFCRYWGVDTAGDLAWHKIELYFYAHPSSGIVRMWVDGALRKECTGMNLAVPGSDSFYGYNMSWTSYIFPSNWSGAAGCCAHDATNYAYWDDFEVFTDSAIGTPATGSLANATVSVSGGASYTVTPSAGANGTISPNTAQTVSSGATTQFTVTPSGGYTASAGGCGGSLVGTTYTTGAITGNCTVTATFGDTQAPTVTITAPAAAARVAGASVAVTATASDNSGAVAGVQFKLDGANLGAEDTTAPFAVAWNSATAADGDHVLTATALDAAGNSATSAGVTVTVDNTPPSAGGALPTGNLAAGATTATLRVTTSETAECRHSAASGFAWESGTPYTVTGGTAHSATMTVAGGRNYRRYTRCQDPAGNASPQVTAAFFAPRSKPTHRVW